MSQPNNNNGEKKVEKSFVWLFWCCCCCCCCDQMTFPSQPVGRTGCICYGIIIMCNCWVYVPPLLLPFAPTIVHTAHKTRPEMNSLNIVVIIMPKINCKHLTISTSKRNETIGENVIFFLCPLAVLVSAPSKHNRSVHSSFVGRRPCWSSDSDKWSFMKLLVFAVAIEIIHFGFALKSPSFSVWMMNPFEWISLNALRAPMACLFCC